MIHVTLQESIDTFNEILKNELDAAPLDATEITDFGIVGGETIEQLREWARDYVSELQTERAEAAHLKKMGNYYD